MISKPKIGSNILPMSRVYHNNSFLLTENQDMSMCHDTLDSNVIEIQST